MTKEELQKKIELTQSNALDELIHDAFSSAASDLNNQGIEFQLNWLLSNGFNLDQIDQYISRT